MNEIVWIDDEELRNYPAELLRMGAYYSLVRYTRGGIDYEVYINNDNIIFGESDDDDED